MKKRTFLALLVGIGVLLGCAPMAFADHTPKNPKTIQGYDNLYADLNHDGHTERVGLVGKIIPGDYRDTFVDAYQIVVMNDKGKTIWRSDFYVLESDTTRCMSCLLHDIDGDGDTELIFTINRYTNFANDLYARPYRMYKWINGAFRVYNRTSQKGFDPYTYFVKGDDNVYRVNQLGDHSCWDRDKAYDGLYGLRKVNGKLWGDIVVQHCQDRQQIPCALANDEQVIESENTYYICKTARLEPSDGGLRVVEYKQF